MFDRKLQHLLCQLSGADVISHKKPKVGGVVPRPCQVVRSVDIHNRLHLGLASAREVAPAERPRSPARICEERYTDGIGVAPLTSPAAGVGPERGRGCEVLLRGAKVARPVMRY